MTSQKAPVVVLIMVCWCVLGGNAHALITAAADGDWSATSTWTGGVVPTITDYVDIFSHHVSVSGTGGSAWRLIVGSLADGSVTQTSGTLTLDDTFQLGVGHLGGSGDYTISGGTLDVLGNWGNPVYIGPGTFAIEGGNSTITFRQNLVIGNADYPAKLIIRPTADGGAGLTPILVTGGALINVPASTLAFEPSVAPEVGQSWDVLSAGLLAGSFGTIEAPPGVTLNVTYGGNTVIATVAAVSAAAAPAGTYWSWIVLVFALGTLGLLYLKWLRPVNRS